MYGWFELIVIDPPDVVFAPDDASVHETDELGVAVMANVLPSVASIVWVEADAGIANALTSSATTLAPISFLIERSSSNLFPRPPSAGSRTSSEARPLD